MLPDQYKVVRDFSFSEGARKIGRYRYGETLHVLRRRDGGIVFLDRLGRRLDVADGVLDRFLRAVGG